MPIDPSILGSTVSITGQQSAEDALAAREAEAQEQRAFTPSADWQAIPEGVPVPPGGDFRMDMATGVNMGRWPDVAKKQDLGTPLITTGEMQDLWASQASQAASAPAMPNSGYMGSFAGYEAPGPQTISVAPPPFDYGPKLSFSAAGTPFQGSRYQGPSNVPYPAQAAASQANAAPEDPWAERKSFGRVDSGFDPWQGPLPSSESQAAPPPSYGSYEEANTLKADILNDARNSWTARGDFAKIGSKGFNAEVQDAYVAQGLAEPEEAATFGGRLKSGLLSQGGYALGYGLMGLGQSASHIYSEENSGQYVTPEQRTRDTASLAPAVGSLIGGAIGSAVAPGIGTVVGGFAGSAVGSVAESVIGAGAERAQDARQTAEMLNTAAGGAADNLGKLTDALDGLSAPIGVIKDTVATMTAAGPGVNGGGTLAGASLMANALGERYEPALSGATGFLSSNPYLRPTLSGFNAAGGDVGKSELGGDAIVAAAFGQFSHSNDFLTLQEGAGAAKDYARDKGVVDRFQARTTLGDGFYNMFHPSLEDAYQDAKDRLPGEKKIVDATDGDRQKWAGLRDRAFGDFTDAEYSGAAMKSGMGVAGGAYGLAELRGASAADLRTEGEAIDAAYAQSAPGLQKSVADLTALKATQGLGDQQKAAIQSVIDEDRGQLQTGQTASAQWHRDDLDRSMQETASAYSLGRSRSVNRLSQGFLSGQGYGELQGQERDILSGERSRADEILSEARNPLLSPGEANALRSRAFGLRTDADTQGHDWQQSVFQENLGNDDNRIGASQAAVGKAEAFSTPGGIQTALAGEADAVTGKIRELTQELAAAGQTAADYRREQGELNQANSQATQIAAQRRDQAVQSAYSQDSDQRTIDTAGMGHAVRNGGSSAVDWDTLGRDWAKTFGDDRNAIGRYTPGSDDWQKARARYAGDQAASRDQTDALTGYAPDARTRSEDTLGDASLSRAEHEFSRARIAPYTDAGADPFARAQGLEAQIGRSQARLGADWEKEAAHRQSLIGRVGPDGKPLWDDAAQAGYDQDFARYQERSEGLMDRRAGLEHDRLEAAYGALPEMVAGSPGRGVGAALITPRAISALYTPNAQNGSWAGVPAQGAHGMAGVSPVSPYGASADVHSGMMPLSAPGAGGMSETNRLLGQLIAEVQKNGRGGTGGRQGGPQAPYNPAGPVNRALGFSYDPNTGR